MRMTSRMFARLALVGSGVVLVGGAARSRLPDARSLFTDPQQISVATHGGEAPAPADESQDDRVVPPERGQVLIRNRAWDSVRVEMRAGPSENCDENGLVAVRTLQRGRRWQVATDDNLCWRREVNPNNPTREFTPWVKRKAGAGQSIAELLQ